MEAGTRLMWVSTEYRLKSFLETVRERVVIYDGAMGTQILARSLSR